MLEDDRELEKDSAETAHRSQLNEWAYLQQNVTNRADSKVAHHDLKSAPSNDPTQRARYLHKRPPAGSEPWFFFFFFRFSAFA